MKYLIICSVLLAECGGIDNNLCGLEQVPYALNLSVSPNPARVGQEIAVVATGWDGACQSLEVGSEVHFFVNGYGFELEGSDAVDVLVSDRSTAAVTLLGRERGWGFLHAITIIDGEIIEAEAVKVWVD